MSSENGYPENPVLLRYRRGSHVESVHRGTWVLVDGSGAILAGEGAFDEPFFARSSVKAFQALPLLDTGAAEHFSFDDEELTLALASHEGEPCHTDVVRRVLARLGLDETYLRCGPQQPGDARTRLALRVSGTPAGAIHNNCSGKHAGFLALALHLGVEPERYLDPDSEGQVLVRETLAEFTGLAADGLQAGIDGCSAPTFRVVLSGLATAFARLSSPDGLPPRRREQCRRLTAAVAHHPVLLAGSRNRLCTDLVRASEGRLFPKLGAEAVYAVGIRGADRALAVKVDDGALRAVNAFVPALLRWLGFLDDAEHEALGRWTELTLRNRAGLEVGRIEPVLPA